MRELEPPQFVVLILYAIAAVSGGLGGCAAASYFLTHSKQPSKLPFFVAYVLLGICFGVAALAVMFVYGPPPMTVNEIILYCMLSGTAGSVVLASANFTMRMIFKKLGLEVQITLRKPEEERRQEEGRDDSGQA